MKQLLLSSVCAGLLLNITVSETVAEPQFFVICYEDKEQPPYYYGRGPKVPQDYPGLYVEVLNRIEARVPVLFSIVRRPWKRCLKALEQNAVQGVMGASYLPQREKLGQFPMLADKPNTSLSIAEKSYVLYQRKRGQDVWDEKNQKVHSNKIIGVPRSYAIKSRLEDIGAQLYEVDSTQQGFSMLMHGRLDGLATLQETGDHQIQKDSKLLAGIKKVENIQFKNRYYILLSHKFYTENKTLSEAIWKAAAKARMEIMPIN